MKGLHSTPLYIHTDKCLQDTKPPNTYFSLFSTMFLWKASVSMSWTFLLNLYLPLCVILQSLTKVTFFPQIYQIPVLNNLNIFMNFKLCSMAYTCPSSKYSFIISFTFCLFIFFYFMMPGTKPACTNQTNTLPLSYLF